RALAGRGHRVVLVTTAGYELEGRAVPDGMEVRRWIARWTQRPGEHRAGSGAPHRGALSSLVRKVETIADAFAVAWKLRRLRPDLIHLHSTNPAALLYMLLFRHLTRLRAGATRLAITAHVVTPHEKMPLERAIFGRIYRLAHLVVAHSQVDRGRLESELGVDPARIEVIPHGDYGFFAHERRAESGAGPSGDSVTARRQLGLEPGEEVALFFGYIREYKGLDVLLAAWEAVRAERPSSRLLIAGDPARLAPARRRELEAEAHRLGALCHFGYIPFADVERYFTAADVLVMPYRRISQSGVLYLALSLGVPVLATRVGALPEMLRDGESARLVPPEDPTRLAEALVEVLGDPELRTRLAEGGKAVAESHSWPVIAERTERAFEGAR
ncbi:MAG: glycosyltransferase family 4 protein, partial [Holophagales bacterium]|nr:glycosyltransferase family 4 protein [Holophagales bacterium]